MELRALVAFVGIVSYGLLIGQIVSSIKDRMFTVHQALRKGLTQVLTFVWHLGMWGDWFLLSPWFMYVSYCYASQWHPWQIVINMVLGMVISAGLHVGYAKAKIPEAHAHDGKLTVAGWLHLVYMGLGIGYAFQFYFFTKAPTWLVVLTSAMFGIHMTLATHIVPALWCMLTGETWFPNRPWRDRGVQIFVLVLWTILTMATLIKIF